MRLSACPEDELGAELGVDFRAEAFVLGWGKDERSPIWEGEFDFPGRSDLAQGETQSAAPS